MEKIKDKIIGIAITIFILIGLFLISIYFITTINKLRNENSRLYNNFLNSQFIIDSVKNKNGEYHNIVNGLMLNKKELKEFNDSLVKEIDNLNIKLKNTGTITKIEYIYIYDIDTLTIEKLSDSIFIAKYNDEWLNLSQKVRTFNLGKDIKIDSINIELKNNLLLVEEIEYKGWWFWKKAKGFKIHIQSDNPYMNLNKTEYYKIGKQK